MRGLVKGKRWLLLTRWVNLSGTKRQELNTLFSMNRPLLKAYLLKESLERLWFYPRERGEVSGEPCTGTLHRIDQRCRDHRSQRRAGR
jgi:Transposase